MTTRINQVIALLGGQKGRTDAAVREAIAKVTNDGLTSGISRKYTPKDEDGDRLPSESQHVRYTATEAMDIIEDSYARLIDLTGTLDFCNCTAMSDITIDDKLVAKDVPVTTLMFLEKAVKNIRTEISRLPTLDTTERWHWSDTSACYESEPSENTRNKKVLKTLVKYEATKEHPAQVDAYQEDVPVGTWTTTKFSGAIPEQRKREMLHKADKLLDAIKVAREQANAAEVKDYKIGDSVLEVIFG